MKSTTKNGQTQATVWVTTHFIGFHQWPEAPQEVSYLQNLHRHRFNVKVCCHVTHDDRDIEFHLLKKAVEASVNDASIQLGLNPHMSCENLGQKIGMFLNTRGYIPCCVSVDEDGECGADVHFN